ncbi:hypothetical protein [Sphaerotilus sp.]|uniref:hypothetical protein n=1 Tax=Sphaerotilus sp. TaxID=2093942 RepID=UPI002ACD3D18|nr:hypothetical protein [Sphaerotilus sp.]MDZ7855686.1 hypothetical protein [Sphaerotilus sp.]
MSAHEFIDQLVLSRAVPVHLRRTVTRDASAAAPAPAPDLPAFALPADLQAAVDVGSVLSFVDGVGVQARDDVLYSVQLAQRGASGRFDRHTQVADWYGLYVQILESVGWTAEQLAFATFRQTEGELRLDKAALAVIAAVATQNQLAVLTEALGALEALADENGSMQLFNFHSQSHTGGNFQIGAVQRSANGALSMALGAFHFRCDDRRRRVLFTGWGAQALTFWTAAQKLTLNTDQYAAVREPVRHKLGVASQDFLAGLVLG